MSSRKYYIKGMVCERCIEAVRTVFENSGVNVLEIGLGEVELIAGAEMKEAPIESKLKGLGFSLLRDKNQLLVKGIKEVVADVYSGSFDFPRHFQFSNYISCRLCTSYKKISRIFSAIEGRTLEQYILQYKIDKIKELLVYTELSLSAIAFQLDYSSVAHLSGQFKSFTGLTPSFFKALKSDKKGRL